MRRRDFIGIFGSAAAIWPLAARGQEADRTYRLGFLTQVGRNTPGIVAFFDELRAHGFIEGGNLRMIPGGFGVAIERIGEVAETMVKAAPDAIVAGPELPLRALQTLTRTIPLIGMTEDMVAEGFAASLARPGGNITGISLLSPELDGKRQDILIEAAPGVRRIAALADANITPARHLRVLQGAAGAHGVELLAFEVATPEKIVPAIDEAKAAGAQALNFLASSLFFVHRRIAFERAAVVHARDLSMARNGGRRRPRRLRITVHRDVSAKSADGREDIAGRQAGRPPGRATDPFRAGDQSQGGAGYRSRGPRGPGAARRQGD
jgi:putative tryptophan/tyrosine transport system substrate-binding protein